MVDSVAHFGGFEAGSEGRNRIVSIIHEAAAKHADSDVAHIVSYAIQYQPASSGIPWKSAGQVASRIKDMNSSEHSGI